MKLLRLTTRERTALFDAAYQGDLVIPPNSKIALQSVSINADPASLVVDGENNQITYQVRDGLQRVVTIPDGEYFASSIDIFNRRATVQFNNSCSITFTGVQAADTILKRLVGLEWLVQKNLNNKEQIGYKIGKNGEHPNSWELQTVERGAFGNPQRDPSYRSSDAANVSDASRCMLMPHQIAKGYGYARCKVGILNYSGDPNTSGFIWGVTRNLDVKASNMQLTDIAFGILVNATTNDGDKTGKQYQMVIDGVVKADVTPMLTYQNNGGQNNTNEFVEITVNGDQLVANIYRNGSAIPEKLIGVDSSEFFKQGDEQAGDVNNRLQPLCVFRGGSANAMINSVAFTPSPYGDPLPIISTDNDLGATLPPKPALQVPYNNFLFFESDSLALFMGYENRRIPSINFISRYDLDYEAIREMSAPQEADAFLIEMLNMQLDSYDSFSNTLFAAGGQRKNILSIIPSANSAGKIVYEPPYPTFIDIANEQPMFIRNLRARVVRSDYSEIFIRGLATLVILIDTN